MTSTEVLTISQAAKRAGWSRRRMYRFLMAQHRKVGGLLVDVSSNRRPMWTVSLGALRSIAPEWAADPERVRLPDGSFKASGTGVRTV